MPHPLERRRALLFALGTYFEVEVLTPGTTDQKATIKPIIQQRLNQYDAGDLRGLISDYKADVILAKAVQRDDRSDADIDVVQIPKAVREPSLLGRLDGAILDSRQSASGLVNHRHTGGAQRGIDPKNAHPLLLVREFLHQFL